MCVCGHDQILFISGKTSDLCYASFGDVYNNGYVPRGLGIDIYGDYIEINICINCGRIQGNQWPLDPEVVVKSINVM